MSYNIADNRVPSEILADLPARITDAKRNAPVEEHPMIDLAGQVIHWNLQGLSDDVAVELQAHGACTPSTGAKVWYVNFIGKAIRTRTAAPAPVKAWDPSQGPLGAIGTSPAAPAAPATVAGAGAPAGSDQGTARSG